MKHAKVILLVLCGTALLAAGAGVAVADNQRPQAVESPEATPAPTATPEPPQMPSDELVAATLKARRNARAILRQWNRARRCFDKPARRGLLRSPGRGADAEAWEEARDSYRALRLDWRDRFHRLRYLMRHPGGAALAARWKPLALWVGWKRFEWPMLAKVMQRESTSCPRRRNASGAWGLLQLMPGWYRGLWPIKGRGRHFNAGNPELNLHWGEEIHDMEGWKPWAATAY